VSSRDSIDLFAIETNTTAPRISSTGIEDKDYVYTFTRELFRNRRAAGKDRTNVLSQNCIIWLTCDPHLHKESFIKNVKRISRSGILDSFTLQRFVFDSLERREEGGGSRESLNGCLRSRPDFACSRQSKSAQGRYLGTSSKAFVLPVSKQDV